jgi:hypothetical protein
MSFSPQSALYTLRPDLSGSLEEFDLAAQNFQALNILPVSEVASQQGVYGIMRPEELLQQRNDLRAPGTGYNRNTAQFDFGQYYCKDRGLEEVVDDMEATAYANYVEAEAMAARRARDGVLRNLEIRNASLAADTTNYFTAAKGNTTTVSKTWNDATNADPISDVISAQLKVYQNLGVPANAILMSYKQFLNLRVAAKVKSDIKYSGLDDPKMPVPQVVEIYKAAFNVKHFFIANAQYQAARQQSSKSGTASRNSSLTTIWADDNILVAKIAETEDFREVCLGRTFHWAADGSSKNATIESYRDEGVRGTVIRCRMCVDSQILYPLAGCLITGANAAS